MIEEENRFCGNWVAVGSVQPVTDEDKERTRQALLKLKQRKDARK